MFSLSQMQLRRGIGIEFFEFPADELEFPFILPDLEILKFEGLQFFSLFDPDGDNPWPLGFLGIL